MRDVLTTATKDTHYAWCFIKGKGTQHSALGDVTILVSVWYTMVLSVAKAMRCFNRHMIQAWSEAE